MMMDYDTYRSDFWGFFQVVEEEVGLAILIPFCFGWKAGNGLCFFMLGMHAVVHTGSPIPAILFNTPDGSGRSNLSWTVIPWPQEGRGRKGDGAALAPPEWEEWCGARLHGLTIPVVGPSRVRPPEFF